MVRSSNHFHHTDYSIFENRGTQDTNNDCHTFANYNMKFTPTVSTEVNINNHLENKKIKQTRPRSCPSRLQLIAIARETKDDQNPHTQPTFNSRQPQRKSQGGKERNTMEYKEHKHFKRSLKSFKRVIHETSCFRQSRSVVKSNNLNILGELSDKDQCKVKPALLKWKKRSAESSVTLTGFLLAFTLILSYTPFFLVVIPDAINDVYTDHGQDSLHLNLVNIGLRLYFATSAINPFIYFACNLDFRRKCKTIFWC